MQPPRKKKINNNISFLNKFNSELFLIINF